MTAGFKCGMLWGIYVLLKLMLLAGWNEIPKLKLFLMRDRLMVVFEKCMCVISRLEIDDKNHNVYKAFGADERIY